jgi:hypothetical protein
VFRAIAFIPWQARNLRGEQLGAKIKRFDRFREMKTYCANYKSHRLRFFKPKTRTE